MRDFTLKLDARKSDKYEITSQGFLVVDANLTRAGVFDYYDNGKLVRELRSPEEVFKQASLDSLKFAPLTMQHPKDMVDASNVQRLQIGMVGENIVRRGDYVGGKIVVTDKASIDDILAKWDRDEEAELSMGYKAEVLDVAGTHHKDGPYDKMQTDIEYNHASVVDRGRAGSNVKLIKDSDSKQLIRDAIDETTKQTKKTEGTKMFKFKKDAIKCGAFKMDSIMEDVDDSAKGVVDTLAGKVDEAAGVIATMKTDHDELQAKFDESGEAGKKLQAKVDELSDPTSAVVQAMIKARTDLEGVAGQVEVKTSHEDGKMKDDRTLKVDVITAIHPEFKADDQTDVYIGARLDAVVAGLIAEKDSKAAATFGKFRKDVKDTEGKEKKEPREVQLDELKNYHEKCDK